MKLLKFWILCALIVSGAFARDAGFGGYFGFYSGGDWDDRGRRYEFDRRDYDRGGAYRRFRHERAPRGYDYAPPPPPPPYGARRYERDRFMPPPPPYYGSGRYGRDILVLPPSPQDVWKQRDYRWDR